jgi:hypothetical protein
LIILSCPFPSVNKSALNFQTLIEYF